MALGVDSTTALGLTLTLRGRLPTYQPERRVETQKSTAQLRAWHFMDHGPLQRIRSRSLVSAPSPAWGLTFPIADCDEHAAHPNHEGHMSHWTPVQPN